MLNRLIGLFLIFPFVLFAISGYVTNFGNATVSVFDTETSAVTGTIGVGDGPNGIIIANGRAYVANSDSNTISVIDINTNLVTATIGVDTSPVLFAVSGTNLYVTNLEGNGGCGSVNVIDILTNSVTATIIDASFNGPYGIGAIGTSVYVLNFGAGFSGTGNTFSVIDTGSNMVTDVITLSAPSEAPIDIAFYGTDAYVVNNFSPGNVVVIDTTDNTISATIDSAGFDYPSYIVVNGSLGYATNNGASTMSVIDLDDNIVTATVTVGAGMSSSPDGIAIFETSGYVTNYNTNSVSVVDLDGYTYTSVSDPDSTFNGPSYVAFPPPVGYVANFGTGDVSVFDTVMNMVTATIGVGEGPSGIIIVNGYAYVLNNVSNNVSVIDTATNTVVATISVDSEPTLVALTGTRLYLTNTTGGSGDGSVNVIDTSNNTVIATITDASFAGPYGIGILGNYAYVTNYGVDESGAGNTVSVIDTMTNEVTAVITVGMVGASPSYVGFFETNVYVVNNSSPGTVVVIDSTNNTVIATITDMDHFAYPIAIITDEATGYVTNNGASTVTEIDLNTNMAGTTFPISSAMSSEPYLGAILGNALYVGNGNNTVSVVDLVSLNYSTLYDPNSTISNPGGIAFVYIGSASAPTPSPTSNAKRAFFNPVTPNRPGGSLFR